MKHELIEEMRWDNIAVKQKEIHVNTPNNRRHCGGFASIVLFAYYYYSYKSFLVFFPSSFGLNYVNSVTTCAVLTFNISIAETCDTFLFVNGLLRSFNLILYSKSKSKHSSLRIQHIFYVYYFIYFFILFSHSSADHTIIYHRYPNVKTMANAQ